MTGHLVVSPEEATCLGAMPLLQQAPLPSPDLAGIRTSSGCRQREGRPEDRVQSWWWAENLARVESR